MIEVTKVLENRDTEKNSDSRKGIAERELTEFKEWQAEDMK